MAEAHKGPGAAGTLMAGAAIIAGLAQYLLTADGLLVGVLFPLATAFITYAALTSYRHLTCEREKRLLRRAATDR